MLELIDIAFSDIKKIELFQNIYLQRIIADKSQRICKKDSVLIERVYNTVEYIDHDYITLGRTAKCSMGKTKFIFNANIVSSCG